MHLRYSFLKQETAHNLLIKIKKTNYAAKSKLKVKNRASDQRGKVLNRLSSSYFEAETVVAAAAAAALASTSLPTTPIHFAPKEHRDGFSAPSP